MDESGLFYRALPTRTYVSSEEGDRTRIRGSKTLRAKDRVTLILCVNADGSCKIPPPRNSWQCEKPALFSRFTITDSIS